MDAITLGAWVSSLSLHPKSILDVGTGTGILALMMAQSQADSLIDAVELDDNAIVDAQHNFDISPWSSRLSLHHADFKTCTFAKPYDLIISNPPYYTADIHAPQRARAMARSESTDGLSITLLLQKSKLILEPTRGSICLIAPPEREQDIRRTAVEMLMRVRDICHLYTAENRLGRVLVRLQNFTPYSGYQSENTQHIHISKSSGGYTEDYRKLLEAFLRL